VSIISQFVSHILQSIALGVSFNLILQSESNWPLLNGTWQKRRKELYDRSSFEIFKNDTPSAIGCTCAITCILDVLHDPSIPTCDMTYAFICVTWLMHSYVVPLTCDMPHMCAMTHKCAMTRTCAITCISTCDMTHTYETVPAMPISLLS